MEFNGRLEIKPTDILLKKRGLQDMGAVQKYIDRECIRLMKPYTPMRSSMLIKSATLSTVIGSGEIHQNTPYARYQYYGKVYEPNYPIFEGDNVVGFYSPPKKYPTGRELKYDKSKNPNAGKMWFERMKENHKKQILKGAQEIANRGG